MVRIGAERDMNSFEAPRGAQMGEGRTRIKGLLSQPERAKGSEASTVITA